VTTPSVVLTVALPATIASVLTIGSAPTIVLAATIGPVPTTVVLGVGSAALVWGLRYLIRMRRRRPEEGSGGARGLRPDGAGTGPAIARREGSAAPDVAVRIPLPGDRPPRDVRHAELYAVELGLVGGGTLAWLASLAIVDPLVGSAFGAVLGAVSFWRVRTMAASTVARATGPWLGATIVGAALGVLLFF